jgi:hypothetical protein
LLRYKKPKVRLTVRLCLNTSSNMIAAGAKPKDKCERPSAWKISIAREPP